MISTVSDWFRSYGFADVYDNLIVGALPLDQSDVHFLERIGVARVFNLVEDREYRGGARDQVEQALENAGIVEERLSSEDYGGLSNELLEDSARIIKRLARRGSGRLPALSRRLAALSDGGSGRTRQP